MVRKAWNMKERVEVIEMRKNAFMFKFNSEEEGRRVLQGRPWSILGQLFCLNECVRYKVIDEISFDESPFWIQLHNLPLEVMNVENAVRLGSRFGRVVMVEDPEWNEKTSRGFMRIRVVIDVHCSLVPGFWLERPDETEVWIYAKYEKLNDFCYKCGHIDHDPRTCTVVRQRSDYKNEDPKYGQWLSASQVKSWEEALIEIEPKWFEVEGIRKRKVEWGDWRGKLIEEDHGEKRSGIGGNSWRRESEEITHVEKVDVHVSTDRNPKTNMAIHEDVLVSGQCWDNVAEEPGEGMEKVGMKKNEIRILNKKFVGHQKGEGKGKAVQIKEELKEDVEYKVELPSDEEKYGKAIVPYVEREMIQEVVEKFESIKLKREAEEELMKEDAKKRRLCVWPVSNKAVVLVYADDLKKAKLKGKRGRKKGMVKVKKDRMEMDGTRSLVEVPVLMAEGGSGWPLTATGMP